MASQILLTDPDQTISGTHQFQGVTDEFRQIGASIHAVADESRGITGAAQVGRTAACERAAAACEKVNTVATERSTGAIDLTTQNAHNADETQGQFASYDMPIGIV